MIRLLRKGPLRFWQNVRKYVSNTHKKPSYKSFSVVQEHVNHALMDAKLCYLIKTKQTYETSLSTNKPGMVRLTASCASAFCDQGNLRR